MLNLSLLHEDVNLEEYGTEIYNDIYCRNEGQLLDDYRTNLGVIHIEMIDKNNSVVSLIRCLLEVRCVSEHLLLDNLCGQDKNPLSHLFRELIELVYRTRFEALKQDSI